MSLRDWLQSFNSSKSSKSLLDFRSFDSCSAPTTSAASRLTRKRKSAYANDLGVNDPKQIKLGA